MFYLLAHTFMATIFHSCTKIEQLKYNNDVCINEKASCGGITLLKILAFCFFLSGPFVMAPEDTSVGQANAHGTIHGTLGAIAFLLMPINIFGFLCRFQTDKSWAALLGWSLVLGIVSASALVVLSIVTKVPQFQSTFENRFDLIQGLLIIPFMIWVCVFVLSWPCSGTSKSTIDHSPLAIPICGLDLSEYYSSKGGYVGK